MTRTQITLHWKKDGLQLSRSRVLQQLQAELSPRYRKMLNEALADLDKQLTQFD